MEATGLAKPPTALGGLVQRLKTALPGLHKEKKVLVRTSPAGMNTVTLGVICSGLREGGNLIHVASVDRPSEYISRLVNPPPAEAGGVTRSSPPPIPPGAKAPGVSTNFVKAHCGASPGVKYSDINCSGQGRFQTITGLFAPKLLLETEKAAGPPGTKTTLVLSNLSALTYYNSNDRIKEFISAIDRKLADGTLDRVVIIMDDRGQYIYSMAKAFTGKEVDIEG